MDFITYLQQHVGHEVSVDYKEVGKQTYKTRTIRAVNRGWLMTKTPQGLDHDIYIPHINTVICITCVKATEHSNHMENTTCSSS